LITFKEAWIMKKLTAEEFAEKVMENGTEIDYSEWASKDRGCEVWEIYAHINENGEIVHGNGEGIKSILTYLELENEEQSEAFMNGELDDKEKELIIKELYPEYLGILKNL
jgi:hypothetical protein